MEGTEGCSNLYIPFGELILELLVDQVAPGHPTGSLIHPVLVSASLFHIYLFKSFLVLPFHPT